MRKLALLFLLCGFVPAARAATYTAASCNLSDVQTAMNNESAHAANGDVIVIPAGNCSWNGTLPAFNPSVSVTIQGQTTVSGNCGAPPTFTSACAATDTTVIVDGRSGGGSPLMTLQPQTGSAELRLTGVSFNMNNAADYNGVLAMGGSTTNVQIRLDHCHFYNLATVAVILYQPAAYGVVDHNVVDVAGGNTYNGFRLYGADGHGFTQWNTATGFGGSGFTFIENNTFNNGFPNDCNAGGRYVFRYNVMNDVGNSSVQSHTTGTIGNSGRGCRAWEVYGNYAVNSNSTGQAFSFEFQTSGTGLSWNNTTIGFPHLINLVSDRDNGSTNYSWAAPPANWGYCGTAETGIASSWDGNVNSNGSSGWPCIDQPGRGYSDLLSGDFPTLQDMASPGIFTGMWPHQYLEPVYSWMESFSGSSTLASTQSPNNNIQQNRDYYTQVSPFTGASGTGFGTLANRPSTCTPGPGGAAGTSPTGSYGVAYWATDANGGQGELYVCSTTNTWTADYTPYAYPHPLVSGDNGGTSGAPAAPTNLTAVVQ